MSPSFLVKMFELHLEAFHPYKGFTSIVCVSRCLILQNPDWNILTRNNGDIMSNLMRKCFIQIVWGSDWYLGFISFSVLKIVCLHTSFTKGREVWFNVFWKFAIVERMTDHSVSRRDTYVFSLFCKNVCAYFQTFYGDVLCK